MGKSGMLARRRAILLYVDEQATTRMIEECCKARINTGKPYDSRSENKSAKVKSHRVI